MTIQASPRASKAEVGAAFLLLSKLGVTTDDLIAGATANRPTVPTFAEFVPQVVAATTPGTLKCYGTYWDRVVERWGDRRLDEPTPMALQSLQRRDKLKRPRRELKDALGKEIADVAVVMALLADAIGLAFDEIMLERIEDLRARREKLLAEMEPNGNGTTYKRSVPSPTETDQDLQLPLFAD